MAERLGMHGLCFLYEKPRDIRMLQQKTGLDVYMATMQLSKTADLRMARGKEGLREILEKTNVDVVFELEDHRENDFMHQRNSGLNHVLAGIARQKKKMVAFSLAPLLRNSGRSRAQILGRMMQNVALCRKYEVDMAIASFARSPYQMRAEGELKAIGMLLGMQAGDVNAALRAMQERILDNKKRRSPDYLGEGIERC